MFIKTLTRLPGRLKTPVRILITARTMLMVRANGLPDHRLHVMMKPITASMSNTRLIPISKEEVKAIICTLVNMETHGIC